MHSAEQYLHWYSLLQDPAQSKAANKKLVALEQSKQVWNVAKSLIRSSNYEAHKHGCQLLSKKLSNPYTSFDQQQHRLLPFILSLPALNNLLCFCLAKIHIHLSLETIRLQAPHQTLQNLLTILKYAAEATCAVRISQETVAHRHDNEQSRAQKLYKRYQGILVEGFKDPKLAPIVTQCIEALVNANIKLDCPQLVRGLLAQQISDVSSTLEQIILEQDCTQLHQEIFNYLSANSSSEKLDHFFTVFLAFSRSLTYSKLPFDLFQQIISKTLEIMRIQLSLSVEERKNVNYINQTFLFWSKISNQIIKDKRKLYEGSDDQEQEERQQSQETKNEVRPEYRQLAVNAFVEVWNITIQRSILREIPKFQEQENSLSLTLNVDQDYGCLDLGYEGNKFRTLAEDFLVMCYTSHCKNEEFSTQLLKSIYELAGSSDELQLELAIFTLSSVIEYVGTSSIDKIAEIMMTIVKNPNCTNPTIWQHLLKLLGKFGPEATTNIAILEQTLRVIQKSLQINELAPLACQSLTSIIGACSVSACKQQQSPLLQQFLDHIFTTVYFGIDVSQKNQRKKFQLLTNSYFQFIYNFKEVKDFSNYLLTIHNKWQTFTNSDRRFEVLENLTLSHQSINVKKSLPFTPMLSQFCLEHFKELVNYVCECPIENKEELKISLFRVGLIAGTLGGFNSQNWAAGILQILNTSHKNQALVHCYITPATKFLKIDTKDQHAYDPAVKEFIKMGEPVVSLLMARSRLEDYENGLSFHFEAINRHSDKIMDFYNPNMVLNFVCEKVLRNKEFTEFTGLRTSLAILRSVMDKNYEPLLILQEVLSAYPRLAEKYWKSLEAILLTAFKIGGIDIFEQAFKKVKPSLLPPNPLFDAIHLALEQSELKTLKKLFSNF